MKSPGRTALVTGAGGHDGRILTRQLLDRDYRVVALVRSESSTGKRRRIDERCQLIEADLCDTQALRAVIAEETPDEVYNLAAISASGGQWESAAATLRTNGLAVLEILEILRRESPRSRFCQASSCEMFGASAPPPQSELTELRPDTPYAIAKAQAHFTVQAYRRSAGLFACSAILFSHSSEYRSDAFLLGKVARAAADVALGKQKSFHVRNLHATRDWGYAGDYMNAMRRMLQAERPEDYVIATGVQHTVAEACEAAFAHVGQDYRDYVTAENSSADEGGADFLGDASRVRRELAWEPAIDFVSMVERMVDHHLSGVEERGE